MRKKTIKVFMFWLNFAEKLWKYENNEKLAAILKIKSNPLTCGWPLKKYQWHDKPPVWMNFNCYKLLLNITLKIFFNFKYGYLFHIFLHNLIYSLPGFRIDFNFLCYKDITTFHRHFLFLSIYYIFIFHTHTIGAYRDKLKFNKP